MEKPDSPESRFYLRDLNFVYVHSERKFDFEGFLKKVIFKGGGCTEVAMNLLKGIYVKNYKFSDALLIDYELLKKYPESSNIPNILENFIILNLRFLNNKNEAYSFATELTNKYAKSFSAKWITTLIEAAEKNEMLSKATAKMNKESNQLDLVTYPNPFNAETSIKFSLSTRGHLKVTIFDILGREVTALADDIMNGGSHSIIWNAANFSSGIYFVRLEYEGRVKSRKIILIK